MEAERVGEAHPSVEVHASPAPGYGVDIHRFRYAGRAYKDANAGLSCHAIFVQFSGPVAVTLWMAGRSLEHVPSAGTFGIAPAGMDSGVLVRGAIAGAILRIAPECLALASAELGRHCSTLVERWAGRDAKLLSLSRSLDREAASGRREGPLYWSGLADALIGHLATRHMSEAAPARPASMTAHDLRRADDFIRANLTAPLDLASLAASVGHDRFRFAREFRAAVGVTPHRYVTRLRLQRARALLRTRGPSLAEVAGLAGFYDQSHMTNWFRRVYGITPSMAAARGTGFDRAGP